MVLVDGDDLFEIFGAFDGIVSPGASLAPYSRWRMARSRMSKISEDLPDPDTPVTATSKPSGRRTVMFWRLCCARAVDGEGFAVWRAAALRDGDGWPARPGKRR